MNERILVIGSNGQVGRELVQASQHLGDIIASSRHSSQNQIDLSKPNTIRNVIHAIKPTIIINAAAYTAVDKAEQEIDLAMKINSEAPGIIAEEANKVNAKLIHFSTDYIFDGSKGMPYTENDRPNPINIYGESKLGGENAIVASECDHIIFRTSWVYSNHGHNFLKTIIKLSNKHNELKVVDDQIGCPNSAYFIATTTVSILEKYISSGQDKESKFQGVYNLSLSKTMSWYEFSRYIISIGYEKKCCKKISINPVPSDQYLTLARRPKYSVLSNKLFLEKFELEELSWKYYLERCLDALKK